MQFSEKFLYHIWDAQHLKKKLQTISGKSLKIMFQGQWNTDAGPDFKNAIIQFEGEVLRGDVEAHLETHDWNSHHHHEDKNYNNVILHIVFKHNGQYPFTVSENGEKIEILELQNYLDKNITKLLKEHKHKKFVVEDKFCSFFAGLDNESLQLLLLKSGSERLEKKIKRFGAELFFSDFNQLFMQGLFESLGYSKNKFQMLQLALKFPYSKLKEFYRNGMTKDELLTLWLCSSDLISHLPKTFPREFVSKWKELYQKQGFSKEIFDLDWKLFRIRPINHPAVRILQIIDLIYENLENPLFNNVLKVFSFTDKKIKMNKFKGRIYSLLQVKGDESSYSFLPEKYQIGKSRVDIIIINILIPLAILYARKMSYSELDNVAKKVYQEFHGLPGNFITQFMERFMDDTQRKIVSKKAIYQQGILKLYFDFCQHHNCEMCVQFKKELISSM